NVGVSPAAIAVWQLGYPGLVLLIVANALQLYVINSLLLTRSILLQCLAFYCIGLPALVTLFTSPDVILLNLQRVAVLYVVVLIGSALWRRGPPSPLAGGGRPRPVTGAVSGVPSAALERR